MACTPVQAAIGPTGTADPSARTEVLVGMTASKWCAAHVSICCSYSSVTCGLASLPAAVLQQKVHVHFRYPIAYWYSTVVALVLLFASLCNVSGSLPTSRSRRWRACTSRPDCCISKDSPTQIHRAQCAGALVAGIAPGPAARRSTSHGSTTIALPCGCRSWWWLAAGRLALVRRPPSHGNIAATCPRPLLLFADRGGLGQPDWTGHCRAWGALVYFHQHRGSAHALCSARSCAVELAPHSAARTVYRDLCRRAISFWYCCFRRCSHAVGGTCAPWAR